MWTRFSRAPARQLDIDEEHLKLLRDEVLVELVERPDTTFMGVPSYPVAVRDCLALGRNHFLLKVKPEMYRVLLTEVSRDHTAYPVYSIEPERQWRVAVTREVEIRFSPEAERAERWASFREHCLGVEGPDIPEDGIYSLHEGSFLDPIEAVRRMRREREFAEVSPVIISLGVTIPRTRSEADLDPHSRPQGVENRRHPRHKSDFLVQATLLAKEGSVGGTCRDLSLGGAFLEMEPPLPRGTTFHLLIQLSTIQDSLYTEAEVVWARAGGMGVKFVDLDDERLATLERALRALPVSSTIA